MKVNNNISAVITNNQLLRTEDSLAASMERLSSGLKINHAKDNPSGMAISNKMQAQIDGLDQASRNSSDGTSVLETADGALNEVTQMLQRMRELAVQAANDTNSQSEKEAIQVEIDKLKEEVDRISSTTEFNTKSLLDGSLDNRVYAEHASRIQISEEVPAGVYKLTVASAATQARITSVTAFAGPVSASEAGTVSINGYSVDITEGMSTQEVYEALRNAAEIGEASISDYTATPWTFESTAYGADAELEIKFSNDDLAAKFGLSANQPAVKGTDAVLNLDTTSAFSTTATYAMDGNKVTISDVKGFEMSFLLQSEPTFTGDIELNATEMGPMVLQIGANEGQQMSVKIPACDTKSLYIDAVDVTTIHGAQRAISQADAAIASVNKVRSALGAYTNRLESATKSLDETSENMNSAISRISDVDMALEMTEYTRLNVLSQTATSALSQANELPQLALQLLG